jgi:hypothetical protein
MVQLPALNTPQFDWVRSRLPRRAQPVPPIFQPEVAADAIVWASEHDRRELYVGGPTTIGIIGNKLFPALGDWYLARTAYASQQTDEPKSPDSRARAAPIAQPLRAALPGPLAPRPHVGVAR